MSLLDTHIGFLEALRSAGLGVSLAEGLDAVEALSLVSWQDRETVREVYAATLVKRAAQRVTFDAVFDIYFPPMVGEGQYAAAQDSTPAHDGARVRDSGPELAKLRAELSDVLASGDQQMMAALAAEAVSRFGAMPGRGPGLSSWSAYTALQRLNAGSLVQQILDALVATGIDSDRAEMLAGQRIGAFTRLVEGDARRRIAEEKGPRHVASVS